MRYLARSLILLLVRIQTRRQISFKNIKERSVLCREIVDKDN
jgi:hypothetical protein